MSTHIHPYIHTYVKYIVSPEAARPQQAIITACRARRFGIFWPAPMSTHTFTNTHPHIYIYIIYIEEDRDEERERFSYLRSHSRRS